jgi:hypothetical protein
LLNPWKVTISHINMETAYPSHSVFDLFIESIILEVPPWFLWCQFCLWWCFKISYCSYPVYFAFHYNTCPSYSYFCICTDGLIALYVSVSSASPGYPPLIDLNWFYETSSISDSLVNDPSSNIRIAFHYKAHNFTNFIQKVCKMWWETVNIDKIM